MRGRLVRVAAEQQQPADKSRVGGTMTAPRCVHVIVVAMVMATLALVGPVAAQSVDVTSRKPDPASGAPLARIIGFPANTDIEVTFIRTPPDGTPPAFSATARYRTGSDGTVDLATRPLSGDWSSALPEAPFWAIEPDTTAPMPSPDVVLIQATAGSVRAEVEFRLPQAERVSVEPVPEFAGAFLARPDSATGPLPLIIVLGGSDGDDHLAREIAPRLAAAGYAALGLPYYSPDRGRGQAIPGLPSVFSEIPVDRLEQVRMWALTDPRIDTARIGLWGFSKGGEFAIIAAANFPWLDAVAAIAPSDVVWEGFGSGTLERTGTPSFALYGKPLPYVPYGVPGRSRRTKETGREQHPEAAVAARIPIERFRGLLLVAGGEQDQTTNSAGMSESIARHRATHGLETVLLTFRDAAHGLVAGNLLDPIDTSRGGTVAAVAEARKMVWAATLELYRKAWTR